MSGVIYALKTLTAGFIFFVWVVRYREIIEEFKAYNLPAWLRDLVGILKLSFAFMLFSADSNIILLGAAGIILLMVAALITHIRVKNSFYKMLPSASLMILSFIICLYTYQVWLKSHVRAQLFAIRFNFLNSSQLFWGFYVRHCSWDWA